MAIQNFIPVIPTDAPVVIVGGGPVGLSLAISLRLHGVAVVVIERQAEFLDMHPKARANNMRTLEHYRRWGISDEIRSYSWKTRDPDQRVIFAEYLSKPPLGAYPLRYGRHVEESRDLAPEPSLSTPQPFTTRILLRRAKELGAVVLNGWEVTQVQQNETNAITSLRAPDSSLHEIVSTYIVGCDGPSSLVRKVAGITLEASHDLGRSVTYVVHSEGYPISDLLKPSGYDALGMLLVFNAETSTVISIPDDENWGFGTFIRLDQEFPTVEETQRRAQLLLGIDAPITVKSTSSYVVRSLIAHQYRNKRFFLAGDAAHQCPPTGGHNMNVGIDEAVNLAWKLAADLQGWGGSSLLDTYGTERRAVAVRVAGCSMENSAALRVAEAKVRTLASETAPDEKASKRAQWGSAAYELTREQWNTHGIVLDQRYEDSPLTIADGSKAPEWDATEYWAQSRPGHRAPHLWLDDKTPLLDLLGDFFTLLNIEADEKQVENLLAAAAHVGLPVKRINVPSSIAGHRYSNSITLIRPDHYVAWQGDLVDNPKEIVDRVRGFI